jgi:hypothetical protein
LVGARIVWWVGERYNVGWVSWLVSVFIGW